MTFAPNYSPTTNQFTSIPGVTVRYDANGNLLTDNLNSYTWDPNWGNMLTVTAGSTTVTVTYDALGRMVENNAGGAYTEFIYGPTGAKLAKVNGTTLIRAFIALPAGAKAIYNSSGALAYYRHSDWLGSSRLTSTQSRALYSSTAYAPFGEQYATSGTADASFTGQDQDTISTLYDFPARRYSPSQGRWISPDPLGRGAVTLANPQSWNRYAYVLNNPLKLIDRVGLCGDDDDDSGGDDSGGGGDDDDDDHTPPENPDVAHRGHGLHAHHGMHAMGAEGDCGDDDSSDDDDNAGDNPDDPNINKTQIVMDLLNPSCNTMFGGLGNALQALAATTYVNVDMSNLSESSNMPTDQYAVEAGGNALAFFAQNMSSQAWTQSFNWDGPNGTPPSSTTFEVLTFLQPSFYNLSSVNQQAALLHELEHGVGHGADIDGVDQNGNNINIQDVQQNCPEQSVPTQDSQVDGSIE